MPRIMLPSALQLLDKYSFLQNQCDIYKGCAYSAKREVRKREVRPGLKRKIFALRKWLRSEA